MAGRCRKRPSISAARRNLPRRSPLLHDGEATGIKTAFGELLVDPDKAAWTLRDAAGATLSDWAPLGKWTEDASGKAGSFQVSAGLSPQVAAPRFYGSGNMPQRGSLTQTEVNAKTGNGETGLPQYWSSAGYGALMIGADDNAPAAWQAQANGAVAWTVPGPAIDLYLMPAPTLYDWLRDQAELTGFAPVPPRWAFGYMQSRWGWESKDYIDQQFAHFRQDELPIDVFILDFEWYTITPDYEVKAPGNADFVDFSWNPKLLPDPAKQIADFQAQGLQIVGIRKPRLGNADLLKMARDKGWIRRFNPQDPNGGNTGSRNIDYAQPEAAAWWGENNRKFLEAGMAGFWNDEGETSFTQYSYWNLAEVNLLAQIDPKARAWSINRSFAPGLQRFGAAAWTGDIGTDWSILARTPGELLSYSLSGMPYSACDIGGYSGPPDPERMTRWLEAGVFFPVMRAHSEIKDTPHFPWLDGPEHEAARRKALDLRYRLIPYYNSLAHETFLTGAPMMRPLVMEFPADDKVAGMTDEWLMGKGLLAAPILNPGGARKVYFPDDQWFMFGTNNVMPRAKAITVSTTLDGIPLYVRAGTLLPLGPVLQYTGQKSAAPLELQIYPGHDGSFDFVQDDGKTLAYQKGAALTTTFSWNDATQTLSWKSTGDYHGANLFHAMKAELFSPKGQVEKPASLEQDGSLQF